MQRGYSINMEISRRFVLLEVSVILVLQLNTVAFATKHVVGGTQGWDESTDFESWAASQTFNVGDELEFNYTPDLHNVVELGDESAFKSCNVGKVINSLNGGSNTVGLTKTGTRYFACATSGHCQQGMKIKVTTVESHSSAGSHGSGAAGGATRPGATHSSSASSQSLQFLSFFVAIGVVSVFFGLVV